MRIVCDANIVCAQRAFGGFGDLHTAPGRAISRDMLADADALMVRSVTRVTEELLDRTPVRFVASATIGVDHIDRAYLDSRGIEFAYAPGCNATSVAEYVVAALLACARTPGTTLAGRTIGIVGVGNVGSAVQRLTTAIGMRCILNDPPRRRLTNDQSFRPLAELLAEADIVTLHVPLTNDGPDATRHLAGTSFFTAMKPGAVFVNTSRGPVLDEPALKTARSRLSAVVLDVWDGEPVPDMTTVELATIATPHIAGYSFDGKLRGTQMIYEAFCRHLGRSAEIDLETETGMNPLTLDLQSTADPVGLAVQRAYAIADDDERFREIARLPPDARGGYFDRLRREYPRRLEFRHYRVGGEPACRNVLAGLGFGVDNVKV